MSCPGFVAFAAGCPGTCGNPAPIVNPPTTKCAAGVCDPPAFTATACGPGGNASGITYTVRGSISQYRKSARDDAINAPPSSAVPTPAHSSPLSCFSAPYAVIPAPAATAPVPITAFAFRTVSMSCHFCCCAIASVSTMSSCAPETGCASTNTVSGGTGPASAGVGPNADSSSYHPFGERCGPHPPSTNTSVFIPGFCTCVTTLSICGFTFTASWKFCSARSCRPSRM